MLDLKGKKEKKKKDKVKQAVQHTQYRHTHTRVPIMEGGLAD